MSSIKCPNKNKVIASFVTSATVPAQSGWNLRPLQEDLLVTNSVAQLEQV